MTGWRDFLRQPVSGSETGGEVNHPDHSAPYSQTEQQESDRAGEKLGPSVTNKASNNSEKGANQRDGEVPAGGPGEYFGEIFHAGVSLLVSSVALGTFFGALECIPATPGAAWAVAVIVLYPVITGLFYSVYSRIGQHLGAPPQLGNVGLALIFLAWLFLISGDTAAQGLAFLPAAAAALLCGVSLGSGLAAIAIARRCGFQEALHSVARLGREAKRQSWLAATGAAEGEQ